MVMRVATADQFLTCLRHQVWSSEGARSRDWQTGDHLVFLVDNAAAGVAEVTGDPCVPKEIVWSNDIFRHRLPVRFARLMLPLVPWISGKFLAAPSGTPK